MFKIIKRWVFWWKRSKSWKRFITTELLITQMRPPYEPPTIEQVEKFKKEFDMGWDSHMITRVEPKKRYYEASLN